MKKTRYILILFAFVAGLVSCDKFLDVDPDNRTTVDTLKEVDALLGSAYPDHAWITVAELMSDNIDDYGRTTYNRTSRFYDQVFAWEDVTESNNESPENIWSTLYGCVTHANFALDALKEMGASEDDPTYSESFGEAYLCRAYAYFDLANIFCMPYSPRTATKELGIPYVTEPEYELRPHHERGTLAETYAKIEADLLKGLSLMGDSRYLVPKYHFNSQAAYALATRFFLYYEKYEEAVKYATLCLGDNPASLLRDYAYLQTMASVTDSGNAYISSESASNFLLISCYSYLRYFYANYSTYNRYSHGTYVATTEDMSATNIFGSNSTFKHRVHTYSGSMDKVIFWRVPYLFEYSDPVAGTGYSRGIFPVFTSDECLLNRAEALVMLGRYEEACADLNLWVHNFTTYTGSLTLESIKTFYNGINYYTWDKPTIKKELHRDDIGPNEGDKEAMLQCVLGFKRLETMGYGLRWMDLRRYGIKIYRRRMGTDYTPYKITDEMSVYDPEAGTEMDPRWAVQIPYKVRQAGLEPNPRNNQ